MIVPRPFQTAIALTGRLHKALADPRRSDRAMFAVLAAYTALWTLYGVIAKSGQDLHPDMTELVTWAREPALGYFKHPPLAAWVVKLWFAVFPLADWAFYLLAALVPALGLWIVWRLTADYLDEHKRVAGIALLTLIPFFGVLALKFNVNTLLIPLWAATTACFLRAFETRSLLWSALAGLCAAAAMLTKYWSIFLVAGLVLAALLDRRRMDFLRSAAPWVIVAAGAAALAPHLAWLIANEFPPLRYVEAAHPASSLARSATSAVTYLLGCAAYVALPVAIALAASRIRPAALHDLLWPAEEERRLAARAFWLPLLLPVFAAIALATEITSIWSMPAFSLLPVVLLSPPLMLLSREMVDRILALALAFPLVMLVASPLVAIAIHRAGLPPDQTQSSLLAPNIAALWRETTAAPLRIVAGDNAYGLAFYLAEKPSAFPRFYRAEAMWLDDARIAREGMAMVCRADDAACISQAQEYAAQAQGVRETEVTVARKSFGMAGKSGRYRIWALPPR